MQPEDANRRALFPHRGQLHIKWVALLGTRALLSFMSSAL